MRCSLFQTCMKEDMNTPCTLCGVHCFRPVCWRIYEYTLHPMRGAMFQTCMKEDMNTPCTLCGVHCFRPVCWRIYEYTLHPMRGAMFQTCLMDETNTPCTLCGVHCFRPVWWRIWIHPAPYAVCTVSDLSDGRNKYTLYSMRCALFHTYDGEYE